MNRIEEIKERNQRHIELKERGRKPIGDPLAITNRELSEAFFEIKHINDKTPEDISCLLSRLETAEKALERMSTGNFSVPMEYSQIEAYQKYAESTLNRIRE